MNALTPITAAEPTFTLEQQVAQARREMGEARWQELQRQWSDPAFECQLLKGSSHAR